MSISIAYIAQGKLHLKLDHAPVRKIDSEFAQSVQERMRQIQQRSFLRNRGPMANFLPPEMMRAMEDREEPDTPIQITSLCRGTLGQLFYALEVGDVSGIFALDHQRIKEQRLFHGSDFSVEYLNIHPQHNLIACATRYKNGTANIAMMPVDGSRPRDITEGDSIDLAPKWIPGKEKALVFQSAGISRNSNGYMLARGPFAIEELDFQTQEMKTLAADLKVDFLGPQMTADGTLYYIRRPYKSVAKRSNIFTFLWDIILIPFRLLYAIFQWLNFFTMRYTGKPLNTAGASPEIDLKQMKAWDEMIDLEKATRKKSSGNEETPSLVPHTWQLIRQQINGDTEVVCEGVLGFDLGEDGSLIYTNGSAIYRINSNGVSERLLVDKLIEQVMIIPSELPPEKA